MIFSKLLDVTRDVPYVEDVVQYTHNHPWTSALVAVGVYVTYKYLTGHRNLPPGPRNYPILGAMGIFQDMEVRLLDLRPKLGNVIHFKMMGIDYVWINNEEMVKECWVKRGEEFAHRNETTLWKKIGIPNDGIFLAKYDDNYMENRKFMHSTLKSMGFGTPKSEEKTHDALRKLEKLVQDNGGVLSESNSSFKALLVVIIFSIYLDEEMNLNEPRTKNFVDQVNAWYEGFNEGFMMDFFLAKYPTLNYLATISSIKKLKQSTFALIDHFKILVEEHKKTLNKAEIRDIIDHYLVNRVSMNVEAIATNLMLTLPDAVDTAAKILTWAFFYITHFQDVQRRMQSEIDGVVGQGREVSLADRSELPYCEAFMWEVMRATTPVPMLSPRLVREDTTIGGYNIPKGFQLMGSIYAIHYDPELFPDPKRFDPTRFLNAAGKLDRSMAAHVIPFGIGKRMCIGADYSKSQLFLALTYFAQKYNLTFDPSEPIPEYKLPTGSTYLYTPPAHKIAMAQR